MPRTITFPLRGETHSHRAESAVDIENLACDPGREIRTEKRRCVAHVLGSHVPPYRGDFRHSAQHLAEPGDPRGGEGLDRARRDPIDADAFRAEVSCQKADVRLQARL